MPSNDITEDEVIRVLLLDTGSWVSSSEMAFKSQILLRIENLKITSVPHLFHHFETQILFVNRIENDWQSSFERI